MTWPPLAELALLLVAMLGAGVLGGLVAGMFGVGGGTVMVPTLFYAFGVLGVGGEHNLHVAVGTSLAVIVLVSIRSLAAHRGHGAVDEIVLRQWSPWVALGALVGAVLAGFTSMAVLGIVYAACLMLVALQMGLLPERVTLRRDLPTGPARSLLGGLIGLLSAMMGVGGGSFGGMLMTLCGRPIHQAVATASGFGLAIGIPAALGFAVFGWGAEGRPPLSLGFVNLPGAVLMGILTVLVAPYGAGLAHRMDRRTLRRAFGLFLALTAIAVVVKAL